MRTNGKDNNLNAKLITVSYFESQRRVNNTDFTPIKICFHLDNYNYDRNLAEWLQSYVQE